MNWIEKLAFNFLKKRIGLYNLLYETMLVTHATDRQTLLETLVRIYLKGKHIQGSYKGKK